MQGKELDMSTVISPKEIFGSICRNLHFISVAKLLRLSIYQHYCSIVKPSIGICAVWLSSVVRISDSYIQKVLLSKNLNCVYLLLMFEKEVLVPLKLVLS